VPGPLLLASTSSRSVSGAALMAAQVSRLWGIDLLIYAVENYLVIATVATTLYGEPAAIGTVLNILLWDGVTPCEPPAGTEALADPTAVIQIGQTVTV
jgi:hypothetical protein